MTIQPKQTRTDRIIEKLNANRGLIDSNAKGSLEVHFADNSISMTVKVVVQ